MPRESRTPAALHQRTLDGVYTVSHHADHVPHGVQSDRHRFAASHGDLLHGTLCVLDVVELLTRTKTRRHQGLLGMSWCSSLASGLTSQTPNANPKNVPSTRHEGNPPSVGRPNRDANRDRRLVFEGDLTSWAVP